jgi:hypothetical protein
MRQPSPIGNRLFQFVVVALIVAVFVTLGVGKCWAQEKKDTVRVVIKNLDSSDIEIDIRRRLDDGDLVANVKVLGDSLASKTVEPQFVKDKASGAHSQSVFMLPPLDLLVLTPVVARAA